MLQLFLAQYLQIQKVPLSYGKNLKIPYHQQIKTLKYSEVFGGSFKSGKKMHRSQDAVGSL